MAGFTSRRLSGQRVILRVPLWSVTRHGPSLIVSRTFVDSGWCCGATSRCLTVHNRSFRALFMTVSAPRQFVILGLTHEGQTFRPSDWAERLAGAMSSFRPGGARAGIGAHIGYSPYCVPQVVDGVRGVLVDEALRDLEPMAWEFVMNFAKDNELQMLEMTPEVSRDVTRDVTREVTREQP